MDAGAHDRPDYLGIELSFMATLCASEPSAAGDAGALLEQERRFVTEHLLAWAPAYCREMLEHARTPFWQGVVHLLLGFLSEEEQRLAGLYQ